MGGDPVYHRAYAEWKENSIRRMKKLIAQNYNHTSIICWADLKRNFAAGSYGRSAGKP